MAGVRFLRELRRYHEYRLDVVCAIVVRRSIDPVRDPIRGDPRFVALTKLPVTAYKAAPQ